MERREKKKNELDMKIIEIRIDMHSSAFTSSKMSKTVSDKEMQITTGLFGAAVGAFMGIHIAPSSYNTVATVGAFGAMSVADEMDYARKNTVKAFCIGYIPSWTFVTIIKLIAEECKSNHIKF